MTFFKIGLFTFGGGYAMLPLIEKEVVENKRWVGDEEIIDIFAVSQSIPGAIAINSAILIGFKRLGKKGSLAAILGIVLPSFLIISAIAAFFIKFSDNPVVSAVFAGVRPAAVALIAFAVLKVGKTSVIDKTSLLIAVAGLIMVVVFKLHAVFVIIGSAFLGLLIYKFCPVKTNKILNKRNKDSDTNDIL